MLEQIKDLCLFLICGQTLLYFQSGKKYEKICRMILELLILAGIVGMILNFLQSLGFRKGEMEAAGGAVAGMQRSIEKALSKQLGMEELENDFLTESTLESLINKHTLKEIKSKYNYFAEQYGFEIQEIKKQDTKLQVFLKKVEKNKTIYEMPEEEKKWKGEQEAIPDTENPAGIVEIEQIEIDKITLDQEEEGNTDNASGDKKEKEYSEKSGTAKEELEIFRRQFALVLAMEEEKLEVILID